jgi:uncharacterized protein
MPDDNVVKMVNSLAADDNVTAQSAFKDALASKIGTALDDKRQTVAKDWLNAAQDTEAIKDAAGLDKVSGAISPSVLGAETEKPEDETETTPEVETQADQPQDDSDEQPAV